nr:hypothetical protein [Tanacetum cinerariifolium]
MELFAFINHADPTNMRIWEREVREGEVLLLQLTRGGGDAAVADQVEEIYHTIQDEGVNVVHAEDEIQAIVDEKPKVQKKKRTTDGASGSNHPLKKLREDHGTSGHVGVSTGGKSLAAIQDIFEQTTLNVEVGVTVAAIVPFVTSSVTPTPERREGGPTDSVSMANLSSTSLPPLMTTAIAITVIVGAISALVSGVGAEPVPRSIFRDSASPSTAERDVVGPSQPVEVCRSIVDQLAPPRFFSQLRAMDYEQLFAEFNVRVARKACFSAKVRLRSEHNYTERKKFERRCARLTDLLREKDV